MSFNGSGTFVINTAGQPVVSGTVISSTAFNALTADLATGLSTCITKDGQTTPTANIPMGNNKITGLAVGTAATDAANLSQVQSTTAKLITASGTDTVTGTLSPTLTAYAAGQMFYWVAAGTNTGAVTLNIDSLGAKAVTRDGSTALTAGDLRSGEVIVVVYDGTRFQVVSQVNSGGDATFANVSITSALNVGGVATFSAGTAAAPSITTSGDTNTGIFFPAADTIAFAEGGVEAARFNSSGQLDLVNNPILTGGTANGVLYLNGSKVATSGSGLTFDGTNLGVNITSPAQRLHVLSPTTYQGILVNGNAAPNICFATSTNTTPAWKVGISGNNGANLSVSTGASNSDVLTFDTSGNLGLGTSSPATRLDVNGVINVRTNGFSFGRITTNNVSANDGGLTFQTVLAGTFADKMVLNADGNLGIGTTSPGNRLHVVSPDNSEATAIGRFVAQNGTQSVRIGYNLVYQTANQALLFGTNDTERARITSGGDFLVGLTSSFGKLSISSNGAPASSGNMTTGLTVSNGTAGTAINIGTNDGGGYSYIQSAYVNNAGVGIPLAFFTAGTERARITSGGNFCINTTSELIDTGRKLSVVGGSVAGSFKVAATSEIAVEMWNAATSGDNIFSEFKTEASPTFRGSITYNRPGGVVAYNTTSDYRSKDVYGPIQNPGETIDALKIYRGKMKGATIERPMMIAHEAQEVVPYAVSGEKDAVNEDGTPKYQTMDHQILVPLLIAELQSLRKRVAELEAK